MMKTLGFVALGGALGAMSRFGLAKALQAWNPHPAFSVGTLLANLLGCVMMGFLVVWVGHLEGSTRDAWAAFLLTGFLGSLTTFSTFVLEFFKLAEERYGKMLLTHLSAHLLMGALGLWLGYSSARKLWPEHH